MFGFERKESGRAEQKPRRAGADALQMRGFGSETARIKRGAESARCPRRSVQIAAFPIAFGGLTISRGRPGLPARRRGSR